MKVLPTRKHGGFPLLALLVGVTVFLGGCGTKERWYKPHHSQTDFDKDTLVCETTAHEMARQATMLGKDEDMATFVTSFNNCLYRKGWSNTPPAVMTGEEQKGGESLALREGEKVQGFGKSIRIPQDFTFLSGTSQVAGPFAMQNFQWQGPASTFIHIVFQRTTTQVFEPSDYAVVEPFSLYERGRDAKKPDFFRWAVFSGAVKKNWVVGLGGYLLVSKHERIIVVVTRPLPPPEASPPPGMRLSKGQRDDAERFMEEWQGWLAAAALAMR